VIAIGMAVGLSVYPNAELDNIRQLVRLIGAAGLALMIAALVLGVRWAVGWATVVLVFGYGLSLIGRATVDLWAPAYAAGLLVMIESAYASLNGRLPINTSRRVLKRDLGRLLALGLGGAAIAVLVLALSSAPVAYGLLVQVAGVGAAAAVLTTLILLVRHRA
jgi:hypothetical protein